MEKRTVEANPAAPALNATPDGAVEEAGRFEGTFDTYFRNLLHVKRMQLGVSLKQLGEFFSLHWSTLRKWEAGEATHCRPCHVRRVANFLAGKYDKELKETANPSTGRLPREMAKCLENLAMTYQMLAIARPELAEKFIEKLKGVQKEAIDGLRGRR